MFEKYGAARLELHEVSPVQGDLKTLISTYKPRSEQDFKFFLR